MADTPQFDVVDAFKSKTPEQQKALLGKMNQEQKNNLYAKIKAKQTPPAQASAPGAKGSGAVGALGDVAVGFGKAAMETVNTVSKGLNKIPVIGETLAPSQGIKAVDQMTQSTGTAQTL